MNKTKIVIGGFAFALAIILVAFLSINYVQMGAQQSKLVNTQTLSIEGVNTIDIEYQSQEVILFTTDEDTLIVKEYLNDDRETLKASMYNENGKISIKGATRSIFFFFGGFFHEKIEIYVPKSFIGDLQVFTSSGNILAKDSLTLKSLTAQASSGNIEIDTVTASQIEFGTSSGRIHSSKLEGAQKIATSSGSINIDMILGDGALAASSGSITVDKMTGFLDVSCSSGNIRVKALTGGSNLLTSSGKIDVDYLQVKGDITAKASSGNISIKIPEDTSITFQGSTSSGNISTFFDDQLTYNKKGNQASGNYGAEGSFQMETQTTSGSITISN